MRNFKVNVIKDSKRQGKLVIKKYSCTTVRFKDVPISYRFRDKYGIWYLKTNERSGISTMRTNKAMIRPEQLVTVTTKTASLTREADDWEKVRRLAIIFDLEPEVLWDADEHVGQEDVLDFYREDINGALLWDLICDGANGAAA